MTEWVAWTLGALACWRASHLLWAEDGPAGLVRRVREAAGRTPLGPLFDCFYCLSLWVGGAVSAAVLWLLTAPAASAAPAASLAVAWGLGTLALSGAAVLVERLNPGVAPPPSEENPS